MYFKPPFKPDMDFYSSNLVLNGILLSDSCLSKRNKGMYKFNQSIYRSRLACHAMLLNLLFSLTFMFNFVLLFWLFHFNILGV